MSIYAGVFGSPTSKFVFTRLARMVCSEEQEFILIWVEHPYVLFGAAHVTGTWFVVGITNRRERKMIPSLW